MSGPGSPGASGAFWAGRPAGSVSGSGISASPGSSWSRRLWPARFIGSPCPASIRQLTAPAITASSPCGQSSGHERGACDTAAPPMIAPGQAPPARAYVGRGRPAAPAPGPGLLPPPRPGWSKCRQPGPTSAVPVRPLRPRAWPAPSWLGCSGTAGRPASGTRAARFAVRQRARSRAGSAPSRSRLNMR